MSSMWTLLVLASFFVAVQGRPQPLVPTGLDAPLSPPKAAGWETEFLFCQIMTQARQNTFMTLRALALGSDQLTCLKLYITVNVLLHKWNKYSVDGVSNLKTYIASRTACTAEMAMKALEQRRSGSFTICFRLLRTSKA